MFRKCSLNCFPKFHKTSLKIERDVTKNPQIFRVEICIKCFKIITLKLQMQIIGLHFLFMIISHSIFDEFFLMIFFSMFQNYFLI